MLQLCRSWKGWRRTRFLCLCTFQKENQIQRLWSHSELSVQATMAAANLLASVEIKMFLKAESHTCPRPWGWHRILCIMGVAFTQVEFRNQKPNEVINRTSLQKSQNNQQESKPQVPKESFIHQPKANGKENKDLWESAKVRRKKVIQRLVRQGSCPPWLVLEAHPISSTTPFLSAITLWFSVKINHFTGRGGALAVKSLTWK